MRGVNYITNCDVAIHNGGSSAMNHQVNSQLHLSGNYSIKLIQDIESPISCFRKMFSKTRLVMNFKSGFTFFLRLGFLKMKEMLSYK